MVVRAIAPTIMSQTDGKQQTPPECLYATQVSKRFQIVRQPVEPSFRHVTVGVTKGSARDTDLHTIPEPTNVAGLFLGTLLKKKLG